MQYRYDKLQFSSLLPNWTNIGKVTDTISCSGVIANGSGANFTANLSLLSSSKFSDIYLINQNFNTKTLLESNVSITSLWQYTSSETVTNLATYLGSTLSVTISVANNTGGSITLVNQAYTVEVIEYEMPL